MNCPRCGYPLIHRNRTVLLFNGILFLAGLLTGLVERWLLIPAAFFAMIGLYLIAWATIGKGLWCRQCKQVPFDSA